MRTLLLNGKTYDCRPGETVLDALLRQNVPVPHSCMKQTCFSCMMQSLNGTPPIKAQRNLKETQQLQTNFLACACIPARDMEIVLNSEKLITQVSCKVVEINRLNPAMIELVLQLEQHVDFHYVPCVRQGPLPDGGYLGEVQEAVAKKFTDLSGWRVFLCGNRNQVHAVQRNSYLAGASMADIFLEAIAI